MPSKVSHSMNARSDRHFYDIFTLKTILFSKER
jgi:hypothetical protein